MIWALIIAAIWNIGNASIDAKKIKQNRKIDHAANAFFYIAIIFIAARVFECMEIFPALLFIRPLVFDNALNLFRGNKLTYVSESPASIVDQIEKRLFGKYQWIASNLLYLAIVIANILIILYFRKHDYRI